MSPLRSYRDFVASQRDDSDPGTYARRYSEYRRGYAREIIRHFFEQRVDFEWFRDHYDPLALAKRMEARKERAARHAEAFFTEAVVSEHHVEEDKLVREKEIVQRASLDPVLLSDDQEEKEDSLNFESSMHMLPDHKAKRCVLIPNIPSSITKKAIEHALSTQLEDKSTDDEQIEYRLLQSDPSRRKRNGFDYDVWLILNSDENGARAEEILHDISIELPVPPGVVMSAAPWNPLINDDSEKSKEQILRLRRERAAKMRHKECPDTVDFRVRASTPLVTASTVSVDDFGRRDIARRSPRSLCSSSTLSTKARIISDAKTATKLAQIYDERANIPANVRFDAIIAQNSIVAKSALARLDVAAAYLRRVHYFLYYSATFFRDELELLKTDTVWYTRHLPAEASSDDDDTDLLFVSEEEPKNEEPKTTVIHDDTDQMDKLQTTETEQGGEETNDKSEIQMQIDDDTDDPAIFAMDASIKRKLQKGPITTNDYGALAKQARDHCICYDLDLSSAWTELVTSAKSEIDQATEEFMQTHIIAEDHGRARCGFEWCHKLFKSDEFLRKHLSGRHVDYLEAWLTLTRRVHMWKLYDADEHKPLAPVRADNGQELDPNEMLYDSDHYRGRGIGGRGGRGSRGGRGRGDHAFHRGASRDSFSSSSRGPPRSNAVEESIPRLDDRRSLANYADVDAPKRKVLDLDFGVLLPPPPSKKKKKSTSSRPSTGSIQSPSGSTPSNNDTFK